jgi:hypothetical protein
MSRYTGTIPGSGGCPVWSTWTASRKERKSFTNHYRRMKMRRITWALFWLIFGMGPVPAFAQHHRFDALTFPIGELPMQIQLRPLSLLAAFEQGRVFGRVLIRASSKNRPNILRMSDESGNPDFNHPNLAASLERLSFVCSIK